MRVSRAGQETSRQQALELARREVDRGEALAAEVQGDRVEVHRAGGKREVLAEPLVPSGGLVKKLFLPAGYPDSVHPDYLPSRKWAFARDVSSGVASYFGTSAVVNAMGFGAIGPLTAGMAWMIRDSVNGIGKFTGSMLAPRADADPQAWMVRGEMLDAVGVGMEASLALWPQGFMLLAPAGNVVKALGSSTRGAAQATIDKHQAISDNLGEVRSKNDNQQMVASGIGAAVGYGLEVAGKALLGPAVIPLLVGGAVAANLFSQSRYVQTLEMDHLNDRAIRRIARELLTENKIAEPDAGQPLSRLPQRILRGLHGSKAEMGAEVEPFVEDPERFGELRSLFAGRKYLIDWDGKRARVLLSEDSQPRDLFLAVFQLEALELLRGGAAYRDKVDSLGEEAAARWALETSLRVTPLDPEPLLGVLTRAGWEVERVLVRTTSLRAAWADPGAPALQPMSPEEFAKLL